VVVDIAFRRDNTFCSLKDMDVDVSDSCDGLESWSTVFRRDNNIFCSLKDMDVDVSDCNGLCLLENWRASKVTTATRNKTTLTKAL